MSKKTPPSAEQLKRRRRKTPIFSDEFIQWHLNTSKHDECPWCGFDEMAYMGKRKRFCQNISCGLTITRDASSVEFFNDKIEGESAINYGEPDFKIVSQESSGRKKLMAQKESRDGRALLKIKYGYETMTIYWHRDGHCPEDDEGNPVMKIGSAYWYWLLSMTQYGDGCPHWWPAEPLNPLEVLARACTDDPVYFARV